MNGLTIRFTDEEYMKIERMKKMVEEDLGMRVSKNSLVKRLLFGAWEDRGSNCAFEPGEAETFKSSSKGGMERQD